MISVASLLNPANSEPRSTNASSSPSSTYSTLSSPYGSPLPPKPIVRKQRMAKDGAIFTPGKTKGDVNFPPFEDLSDSSIHEIEKYHIYPLGSIRDCPRHIPYNSDKKSFLEKTGRESFEVFQYEFKLSGEEKAYTVMWDYNIGLVRITPFFKCCKYSKTTPAKMLNLNPGLKEITHSITGGALVAQGYWMPYSCALAICATFCAHISGALMPIFGPTFPSQCIPMSHQSYGIMVIEPSIIASATAAAESFRQQHSMASPGSSVMKLSSASPRKLFRDEENLDLHSSADLSHRLRLKRTFTSASIYTTDAENSDTSMSSRDQYSYSPVTPTSSYNGHGWTPDNIYSSPNPNIYSTPTPKRARVRTDLPSFNTSHQPTHSPSRGPAKDSSHIANHPYSHRPIVSYGASPWLSAIPRSVATVVNNFSKSSPMKAPPASPLNTSSPTLRRSTRRNINAVRVGRTFENDLDREYDGEDDGGASPSGSEQSKNSKQSEGSEEMEKRAAWLLMNLSVRDVVWAAGNTGSTAATANTSPDVGDGRGSGKVRPRLTVDVSFDSSPSVKRQKATSL